MATDPTGRVSHLPEMHRGASWKQPVRAATTANITIATALNNGDTLDGVTLATGDRVLVKNQTTGAQNGIYVVGASPARDYDMDQDATTAVPAQEVLGAFVYVIAGTANGGKVFRVTNTTAPTLGSTTLTFTEFAPASSGDVATDTIWDAKGDLAVGTGANTASRLAVGTDGYVLTADSTQAAGIKWASGGGGSGSYVYTAEQDLSGGAAASIDFTSISGSARHLVIECVIRGAKSAAYDDLYLRINNDSGSNYDQELQSAYQTTNAASEVVGGTQLTLGQPAAASASSGIFSYYRIFIPYYSNTNHEKSIYVQASEKDAAGTGGFLVRHEAGWWRSTSAVTRVTFTFAGGNVEQYSIASLYLIS